MKRTNVNAFGKQVKKFVGTTTYRGQRATVVFGFGYQKQAYGRVVCHTQKVVLSYRNWFQRSYHTLWRNREACSV